MKIAVNTRLLLKNKLEGIGWFTFENLKRIVKLHPEHEFYFLFDRPYHPDFIFASNVRPVVIGPPSRHPVLWFIWFEISVKRALDKIRPDIFLSPDGYLPLRTPFKTLAVIHDIAYEHYPETVPFLARKYYRYYYPRFARKATHIATVSDFSRQDIMKYYAVPEGKISVVYNGYNEAFHSVDDAVKAGIRNKFTHGHPYFIFLGGLYPRKNLSRLIEAFEIFKKKTGLPHKLVLAGKHVFQTDLLVKLAEASQYNSDIIFTGRIDTFEEVNALISSAEAMTYVSIFEGFGIPCLEAMKCGIPVITSNTSSMPEVCGEAALYIDPYNPEEIAGAMQKLADDKELKNRLINNGNQQLKKFSWDKTASLLWDCIEKTLDT